jgi:hypothetical protein
LCSVTVSGVVLHGSVYGSARQCRRKFRDEKVPNRQTIHNLVNKLRTARLIIDKKQKHKRRVSNDKLDDVVARLETLRKPLKRLAQETVLKSRSRRATQLLQ